MHGPCKAIGDNLFIDLQDLARPDHQPFVEKLRLVWEFWLMQIRLFDLAL